MLRTPHATTSADPWQTEILPLLPPDLDHLAAHTGAYCRRRAFPDAASLLRGLLAYAIPNTSLRQLGAWAVIVQLADVAPSAWLTRLRAASAFLQALVAHRLSQPAPRWLTQVVRGRLLLVDASALRMAHGTGDDLRLHLAYDLLAGQIAQLVLSDHHTAEHVTHFPLQPGDLLVLDAGYGVRDRVSRIQNAHADALVRIYAPRFPLEHPDGRRLDVRALLDAQPSGHRSCQVYYQHAGVRRPLRLLAWRVPDAASQSVRQRAKARARRKQRPLSTMVVYFADWVILLTTVLDAQAWPDAALWRLYRARWQIELLFKQIKQQGGLGTVPVRTLASAIPVVWARLLLWLLHATAQTRLLRRLADAAAPHPATVPGATPQAEAVVSRWGVSQLVLDTLRHRIQGTWTLAAVHAALPRLGRYLVSQPRSDRDHQATEVAAWLTGIRRTHARPHSHAL